MMCLIQGIAMNNSSFLRPVDKYTTSQNQLHIPNPKTGSSSSLVGGDKHAVDHALDCVGPPGAGDRGPRPGQGGH